MWPVATVTAGGGGKKDAAKQAAAWGMDISRYLAKPSNKPGSTGKQKPHEKKTPAKDRTALYDNTLLSQYPEDDEGSGMMQVVWAASPGAQHAKHDEEALQEAPGQDNESVEVTSISTPCSQQDVPRSQPAAVNTSADRGAASEVVGEKHLAIKQALIRAVNGTGSQPCSGATQSAEEGSLPLTQPQHQPLSAAMPASLEPEQEKKDLKSPSCRSPPTSQQKPAEVSPRDAQAGTEHTGGTNGALRSQGDDDGADDHDSILQQVLAWSSKEPVKTPGTSVRARLQLQGMLSAPNTARHGSAAPNTASAVRTIRGGATSTARRAKRGPQPPSLQTAWSHKRRALLELLDQVDNVVVTSADVGSPPPHIAAARQHTCPSAEPGNDIQPSIPGQLPNATPPRTDRLMQQPATCTEVLAAQQEEHHEQPLPKRGTHNHLSCCDAAHGDAGKQVLVAGTAHSSLEPSMQPSGNYMFSVQDYEDFLDSLDEDMLNVAVATSQQAVDPMQQQQQGSQHSGEQQPCAEHGVMAAALTPCMQLPAAVLKAAGPMHGQQGDQPPQQVHQRETGVPAFVRQPLAAVHNTLHKQSDPNTACTMEAEGGQWKRGKQFAARSSTPASQARGSVACCTSSAAIELPTAAGVAPGLSTTNRTTTVLEPQLAMTAGALDVAGDAACGRLLVGDRQHVFYHVLQVECVEGPGSQDHHKLLRLLNPYQGTEVWAHLHDMWADLPVHVGDTLNLLEVEPQQGPDGCLHASCTSQQGLLVLHPDILLSGTTVSSAIDCPRKAWLSELLGGGSSAAALQGTLMHEVVQAVLCQAAESLVTQGQAPAAIETGLVEQHVRRILSSAGPKLYEVGLDADKLQAKLLAKAPLIRTWAATYVQPQPRSGMELGMGPGHEGPEAQLCISGLADIEEQIWAPRYGLKGQLDASLEVQLRAPAALGAPGPSGCTSLVAAPNDVPRFKGRLSAPSQAAFDGNCKPDVATKQQRHSWGPSSTQPSTYGQHGLADVQTAVVPFEFKSGRPHFSHRAQVSLYLLLMSDWYQQPCNLGLLWNLQEGPRMQAVARAQHELAALMQHRNRLAVHLLGAVRAPPAMLHNDHQCSRCHSKAACSIYHKAIEKGDAASSGFGDAWHSLTGHLTDSHCHFFTHWFQLVELEESDVRARRHALWSTAGPDRQIPGLCMAQLHLQAYGGTVVSEDTQLHCYVFKQQPRKVELAGHGDGSVPSRSSKNTDAHAPTNSGNAAWFEPGELVILSLEGQHANVSRVTIACATLGEVRVLSKKRIRMVDEALQAQTTAGNKQQRQHSQCAVGQPVASLARLWRLDRDEPASGSTIQRANLVELMMAPGQGLAGGAGQPGSNAARLRQLVVDLAAPGKQRILGNSEAHTSASHPQLTQQVAQERLNPDQAAAIASILEMQDYALILGMPGTGKTSTIVEAITELLAAERTILLTAYTNSAVDNIGIKLAAAGIDFVRVPGANLSSVHQLVRPYVPGGTRHPHALTASGFKDLVGSVKVVAATCLGLRHPLLAGRMFDVCILDEASQVSLPASLGPLLRARTFVLVGDHYQLPPLVTNPQAAAQGYGESLFRRLCEAHPQAMVTLQRQYRMADDIMQLSSQLIYSGALQCGSAEVAHACLQLPRLGSLGSAATGTPAWLLQALAPAARVLFLDEDGLAGCQDTTQQDAVFNRREAEVVQQLVAGLLAAGLPPNHLGVVSTYRAQVSLITQLIAPATAGQAGSSRCDFESGQASGMARREGPEAGVEVLTIDKYQGRDKACIILSFVRSNAARQTGRLLMDWQRINVALTRAKHKLLMVGSSSTLSQVPLLAAMLEMLRHRGCVLQLPAGAVGQGAAAAASAVPVPGPRC